ncbi:MAG: DUF4346 domain-containing protein [Candidatus Hodarchaeales archaeon]|jgi:tetrahydromethanopterin S-methyltransferase subunit A
MVRDYSLNKIEDILTEGMGYKKCHLCGCMKETLEEFKTILLSINLSETEELSSKINDWQKNINLIKYKCLGCDYCYPAEASNFMEESLSNRGEKKSIPIDFSYFNNKWPPIPGEYYTFDCETSKCPVAVSTLSSVNLTEKIVNSQPLGLCIIGKTETENIGIEKLIKNVISNPSIQVLLVVGHDSKGHESGKTLLALSYYGVDDQMRIIGAPSKKAYLKNVSIQEIDFFRNQIDVVDMIGCEDVDLIKNQIKELTLKLITDNKIQFKNKKINKIDIKEFPKLKRRIPIIEAVKPEKIKLDNNGYFVIIPQSDKLNILVEFYDYNNALKGVIRGKDAKSIYWTIINNDWISELSHAAYLGKELTKAELSLKSNINFTQNGA